MASTVTAFAYDRSRGVLKELQTITTLPKDFAGRSTTAEGEVHRSGRYLYGSNRGHDSVAVFSIDERDSAARVQAFAPGDIILTRDDRAGGNAELGGFVGRTVAWPATSWRNEMPSS